MESKGRANVAVHRPFHNFLVTSPTDSHYLPHSLHITRQGELEYALLLIISRIFHVHVKTGYLCDITQ